MIVLAHLISAPLSRSQEVCARDRPNRILFGMRMTQEGDEEHLRRFSDILIGLEKEGTFGALHKSLPFKGNADENYDTVNPFGDSRYYQYHALWTFDTQIDMLRYTNVNRCSQIPLGLLRERAVSLANMELLGGPVPVPLEHTLDPDTPYWRPQLEIDDRMHAFANRLLRDFHHQWRHILRNNYNSVTLRVLARAIIRLSTLNFEVHENTGGHGRRGVHVWITQLPSWEPFEAGIVRVGAVWVVVCQDIRDGLSRAQQHAASREISTTGIPSTTKSQETQAHYVILSVKYIMLCHVTNLGSLKHTAPEPLFNGDYDIGPPSDLALDYLIWATASARPSIFTTLQTLPIEIQDIILDYSSVGTVVVAKIGCLLGLGSPFSWKDGSLKVRLAERYYIRHSQSSVESEIWFGESKSGIVYLAGAD
ncbi:hypothetical protein BCR34DRAFT_572300 [Clohesyomyces aquaticus]|uniref:Uncharacterized protein n=1 Tax=Clohesyomyces aquaticus TaxID=1231657 RepID=A0A1Y1Z498_9PLEO|nr:hypothetical protein BCR34DRAFT_572300 [Clohesyomyces aquaticus]